MAWGKVDDKLWGSPKWLSTPSGARALWVTAMSWSMDQLTDGKIPARLLPMLGARRRDALALVSAGLWETTQDGWEFHDWAEYQPSRDQILAERAAARDRQKRARDRARQARQADNTAGQEPEGGERHGVTSPVTSPVTHADVTPRVTVPPTRPDPTPTTEPDCSVGTSEAAPSDTPRADVEDLCTLLADLIEANGAKRPTITKRWRDAARLLLDRDGYTTKQVEWMIRWATSHEFWRANVLSMPTLREKFDRLKLQAMAGHGKSTPESRVENIAALGAQMQADLDSGEVGP